MNATVNGSVVTDITYVPGSEAGPWVVAFSASSAAPELVTFLENPDGPIEVVIEIDEVVHSGVARANLGESEITLVGRGDLTPVTP